jgi:hypothetical protein
VVLNNDPLFLAFFKSATGSVNSAYILEGCPGFPNSDSLLYGEDALYIALESSNSYWQVIAIDLLSFGPSNLDTSFSLQNAQSTSSANTIKFGSS